MINIEQSLNEKSTNETNLIKGILHAKTQRTEHLYRLNIKIKKEIKLSVKILLFAEAMKKKKMFKATGNVLQKK